MYGSPITTLNFKSPAVVAESVVVIKQLLQLPTTELSNNDEVVKQLTRLFTKVENPKAKAAIIWVVGEYLDKVGQYAPDILRLLAKDFINLDDTVKLQVLNLSAKLMVKNPEQTALISQYIFNLAKYDMNYDLRDRGRLLRHLLFNQANVPILSSKMKDLFITTKPSPVPPSYDMRFMVGSLAQTVGQTTPCYNALPEWPDEVQNSELRKVSDPEQLTPIFNKFGVGFGSGSNTTNLSPTTTFPTSNMAQRGEEYSNNLEDFLNYNYREPTTAEQPEEYYDPNYEYPEGEDGNYDENYDPNNDPNYDPNYVYQEGDEYYYYEDGSYAYTGEQQPEGEQQGDTDYDYDDGTNWDVSNDNSQVTM